MRTNLMTTDGSGGSGSLFANLACEDGFRALTRDSQLDDSIEVWLEFRSDGEIHYTRCVWRSSTRTDADYGERDRTFYLWQGKARFFNAGGTLDDLLKSLDSITSDSDFPEILFDHGYSLIQTTHPTDPPTHVFFHEASGDAFVFREDDYVQRTTMAELANQFHAEDVLESSVTSLMLEDAVTQVDSWQDEEDDEDDTTHEYAGAYRTTADD